MVVGMVRTSHLTSWGTKPLPHLLSTVFDCKTGDRGKKKKQGDVSSEEYPKS